MYINLLFIRKETACVCVEGGRVCVCANWVVVCVVSSCRVTVIYSAVFLGSARRLLLERVCLLT